MKKYILAHDLGTSGNKATLFDLEGNLIKSAFYSYELITGSGNTAEQKADDWWRAVCETSKLLASTVSNKDIVAVSFSGQMMGCLCVDKSGNPLYNALIWADICFLDHHTFCCRIGKGNTNLYEIRSCFLHLQDELYSAVRIRVSCGKEADECFFIRCIKYFF